MTRAANAAWDAFSTVIIAPAPDSHPCLQNSASRCRKLTGRCVSDAVAARLSFDPRVGALKPLAQRPRRRPTQPLTDCRSAAHIGGKLVDLIEGSIDDFPAECLV